MSSTQPRMPGLPAVYSAPRLTWKRQAADVIFPCGCVFAPQMQKAAGASARHRRALGIRADCDKGLVRHAHSGRARPLLPTPGTQAWLKRNPVRPGRAPCHAQHACGQRACAVRWRKQPARLGVRRTQPPGQTTPAASPAIEQTVGAFSKTCLPS